MDPAVLGVPALVLVAGGALYAALQLEQRHRRAMAAFAAAQGWTYAPRDDAWARRFPGDPFGTGSHRTASDVLTGVHGRWPLVAFSYSYQTHSTDGQGRRQTSTHRFSVLALRSPGFLPQVEVRPENLLTRFAGALGFAGVELESEEFNQRYRVTAADPRLAYDVLHPRAMQLLLDRPPLAVRLLGADAVSWTSGRLDPAELVERLDTVGALLDLVPARVWADHGGTAA